MDWESVWHWWLVYGFQGIAGGVLGGLVTAVAVWLTLKHDRTVRSDELRRGEVTQQKQVVSRIMEKALDLDATTTTDDRSYDEIRSALSLLDREIRLAQSTMLSLGDLGSTLQMTGGVVHILSSRPRLHIGQTKRLATSVVVRCNAWLQDPDRYDGARHDRAEKVVYAGTVFDDVMFTPFDELEWEDCEPE